MENSKTIELKETITNININSIEESDERVPFYDYVQNKIVSMEQNPEIKNNVFRLYNNMEQEILNEISKSKQKKVFKQTLNELLYENFFKHDDENQIRLKRAKMINNAFTEYLSSIDLRRNLKEDFHIEFSYSPYDKSELYTRKLKKILKQMENCIFDECIIYIMTKIFINYIPLFLIKKKLIKQKVAFIWKINYEIPVHNIKVKSQYGYKYLSQLFTNFSARNVHIFDLNILDKSIIGKIFKCFFLSNIEFLLSNERHYAVFEKHLGRYLKMMNINQPNEIYVIERYVKGKFLELKNEAPESKINEEARITFEELKNLISNEFRILIVNHGGEKILFTIFCFSLMLNNLINFCWEKDQIIFIKEFDCSACERQFLLNFLHNIDSFIALSDDDDQCGNSSLYVNYYLESSIFSTIIKSKALELFDESMKSKHVLVYDKLITYIKSKQDRHDYSIFEHNRIYSVFFDERFNAFHSDFIKNNVHDYSSYSLIPHDKEVISTHICICINDFYDLTLMDQLSNSNKPVDYYCFSWNKTKSVSGFKSFLNNIFTNQNEEIENNSMWAGRFLAFVLASRAVFKFHTFSLIGISDGARVIKHCINELSQITINVDYCRDLINDIIFINGQTLMTPNDLLALNAIASGKIINVYSKNKDNGPEMICSNDIQFKNINNYDISYMMLQNDEFTMNLDNILSKVKFVR